MSVRVSHEKLIRLGSTFFWWGALLLLPGLPFALRDKKMRLLVFTLALGALGVFAVTWSFPHYAAPFTCVIIALLVQSLRHLRTMRVSARPLAHDGSRAPRFSSCSLAPRRVLRRSNRQCAPNASGGHAKATSAGKSSRIASRKLRGKHLIVVRYDPENHNIHDEWVYNGAEIDTAKVLWARELDPTQNARLLAYFKDRHIWLVEPDTDNTELIPYSRPTPRSSLLRPKIESYVLF